jgi:hypothetical protein
LVVVAVAIEAVEVASTRGVTSSREVMLSSLGVARHRDVGVGTSCWVPSARAQALYLDLAVDMEEYGLTRISTSLTSRMT